MTQEAQYLLTTGTPLALPVWNGTLEARIADLLRAGEPVVLVSIVASHGSAPRHAGTRALQTVHGIEGTVGGGILEAQAMKTAQQCLEDGQSRRASFHLDASSLKSDMVCGGTMEVLCEFLTPEQAEMFTAADALLREGRHGVWMVKLPGGDDPFTGIVSPERRLYANTAADAAVPGLIRDEEAAQALLAQIGDRPCLLPETDGSTYVEPLAAAPVLLICGGGHVSLEVAFLAHRCGFVIDIVDDRPEFANASRFPMARRCLVLPGFRNLLAACRVGPHHYVAIMTRGHRFDREVLAQVVGSQAVYVGMIGSKTKRAQVYAALRAEGISEAELHAVCCPIGMAIPTETPQQIAVSVVAELLAARGNVLKHFRTLA